MEKKDINQYRDRIKSLVDEISTVIGEGRFSQKHQEWMEKVKAGLMDLVGMESTVYKQFSSLDSTFHPSSIYTDNSDTLLEKLDKTEFELQMKEAKRLLTDVLEST